jgi:uncharacterized protein
MYYPRINHNGHVNIRTMKVFGNSKQSIQPNVAEIRLGVEVRDQELSTAQQENARKIQQIIASLVKLGISQANIQTIDYHIYPQYDYVDGSQQFKGYQVTHLLSISIENLPQIGKVIDTAVQNGANRVSNIEFTVIDMETHYQHALKAALQNALIKAQTIANAMGLTLDSVPIKILEQITSLPPTQQHVFTDTGVVAGVSTSIEPGRLEIKAKVEVTFQY